MRHFVRAYDGWTHHRFIDLGGSPPSLAALGTSGPWGKALRQERSDESISGVHPPNNAPLESPRPCRLGIWHRTGSCIPQMRPTPVYAWRHRQQRFASRRTRHEDPERHPAVWRETRVITAPNPLWETALPSVCRFLYLSTIMNV